MSNTKSGILKGFILRTKITLRPVLKFLGLTQCVNMSDDRQE